MMLFLNRGRAVGKTGSRREHDATPDGC